MANPLLIAAGLQAGTALVGGLLARRQRPQRPNYNPLLAQLRASGDRRRAQLRDTTSANLDHLNADLAAAGVTGSGGASARAALFRGNAEATADLETQLDAQIADALTAVANREQEIAFQEGLQRQQSTAQSIGNISGAIGNLGAAFLMGKRQNAPALPPAVDDFTGVEIAGDALPLLSVDEELTFDPLTGLLVGGRPLPRPRFNI